MNYMNMNIYGWRACEGQNWGRYQWHVRNYPTKPFQLKIGSMLCMNYENNDCDMTINICK